MGACCTKVGDVALPADATPEGAGGGGAVSTNGIHSHHHVKDRPAPRRESEKRGMR